MAARAVLALIAIATVIGLTACASASQQPAATGKASPGASLCANDQGVDRAGGQGFPAVSVQESGCGSVTGAGPVRSWSASSPFGQQLSEAVGGVGRLVPGTHPSSVPTGP